MTTWIPDTCTLPTGDRPLRLAEWDALFASAVTAVSRTGASSLLLTLAGPDGVEDLVARESTCCQVFAFTVTEATLTIDAPPSCADLIDAIAERAEGLVR